MGKYLLVMATLLLGATSASAATWNGFQKANTGKFMTFFDADTVIKNGDTVTVWIKFVNNVNFPDNDGSYSTAQKVQYSCKKRTSRVLSTSTYDRENEFMKSSGPSEVISDIAPGTIGEDILTAVCTADFPNSKTEKHYFRVEGNDIHKHAAKFFVIYNDIAPTVSATWAGFSRVGNNKTSWYFDVDTATKKGDSVTVWYRYVNNPKYPDSDGSYSTAQKAEFSCSDNTARVLYSSAYDKEGKFIRAYPKPEDVQQIKSGTINHGILAAVCSPDFPNSTSGEFYYTVVDNDIYKDALDYFKSEEAKLVDSAPQ